MTGKEPSVENEYIPSSVKKAAAEARIAEKCASEEWVHIDELCDECRSLHTGSRREK